MVFFRGEILEELQRLTAGATTKTTVEMRRCFLSVLLPFDETIDSIAVFVIGSGSDGWKRFRSQLNNSKMVRYRP